MNDQYGLRIGHYPAVVDSYEKARRRVKVTIEGLGKGLEAELLYPLGDKARQGADGTEIRIEPGDKVWIEFIGGDQRYPLVVGYRHGEAGNDIDWRRWEHANMQWLVDQVAELLAGGDVLIQSKTKITVEAPTVHVKCHTATVDSTDSATVNAERAMNINTRYATLKAENTEVSSERITTLKTNQFVVDCPTTSFSGNVSIGGQTSSSRGVFSGGNVTVTGNITATGNIAAVGRVSGINI